MIDAASFLSVSNLPEEKNYKKWEKSICQSVKQTWFLEIKCN